MQTVKLNTRVDRRLEEAERDATSRVEMLRFQNECNLHLVREALVRYVWTGKATKPDDARHDSSPKYVFYTLGGLSRVFRVEDSPEAKRLNNPDRFNGEFKRITRKEFARICTRSAGKLTRHQMDAVLAKLEERGIIDRWVDFDHAKNKSTLYICFNAKRLMEIVNVEIPRELLRAAKTKDESVKVVVKSDEKKHVDRNPMHRACLDKDEALSVHTHLQCETASLKNNECDSSSTIKRSVRPSARANSSKCFPDPERSSAGLPQVVKAPPPPGIQPPTQTTPERFYRGDSDSQVVTLALGVLEMMRLLRRDFPASQFTPDVIGRITRMMRPSNGGNQLTIARVTKYRRLASAEFAGDNSMFFDEVNLFLSCWGRVWNDCQKMKHMNTYNVANDYVNDLKDGREGILDQFAVSGENFRRDLICDMLNYGRGYKEALMKITPSPGDGAPLFFETNRFLCWSNMPELATKAETEAFAKQFTPKLRAAAEANVADLMVLITVIPELQQCARLSSKEIDKLADRLAAWHNQAVAFQKTGKLYGLGDENN